MFNKGNCNLGDMRILLSRTAAPALLSAVWFRGSRGLLGAGPVSKLDDDSSQGSRRVVQKASTP
jgi:hypothetical protein